jgi:DNA modification methylase
MNRVFFGDCRDTMRDLIGQDVRVQMCVTSPPYYGLRDYGHHGQIGLEATPAEYVAAMVDVFRLVRDLLADDGILWLNLGDTYASNVGQLQRGGSPSESSTLKGNGHEGGGPELASLGRVGVSGNKGHAASNRLPRFGGNLKPKDLIGIPWRVAFALQSDGWWLRQDIIWHKPNPMPESVTDRCTRAHEYLFLFSKSEHYYWDAEAMQERAVSDHDAGNGFAGRQGGAAHLPMSGGAGTAEPWTHRSKRDSFKRDDSKRANAMPGQTVGTHRADRDESEWDIGMRNRRSVWTVPTVPYSGAHFATFPPALIQPCILAGSRVGSVVLDPFFGSGTTGQVAQNLGRQGIGCELNTEYAPLQRQRTAQGALAL